MLRFLLVYHFWCRGMEMQYWSERISWVHQVVVGSFLPGHHLEQKPKKQRVQQTPVYNPIPSNPISDEKSDGAHSGQSPNLATSAATFHRDNLPSLNSMQGSRISAIDENNNICFSREDAPRDHQSPSKGEVSYWLHCLPIVVHPAVRL